MKLQSNRLPPVTTPGAGSTLRGPRGGWHVPERSGGWHVPERSEGRGLVVHHALRCAQERTTQIRLPAPHTARRGFTLLEFVVAMLLFGVAMSGLFPMVVMYSRVLESLEQRPSQLSLHRNAGVDGNEYRVGHPLEWYQVPAVPAVPNSGEWVHKWYLVPSSDIDSDASNAWARKLGASVSITYEMPTNTVEEPLTVPTTADITVWDAIVGAHYSDSSDPAWTDDDPAATDAYGGNQRHPAAGDVGTATWTFTDVVAGWYRVEATGVVSGETTLPADTYKLSYGATVDEDVTPTTPLKFETSSEWCPLTTKYFSAGTVTVQLTTDTSGSAIADAMRIVRCSLQVESWTSPTTETAGATVEIKPAVRTP